MLFTSQNNRAIKKPYVDMYKTLPFYGDFFDYQQI